MNYDSFYEGTVALEDVSKLYDIDNTSPTITLAAKIVNGVKQFIDWLIRLILKVMNSIRNLWNKLNNSFAKLRGDTFVVDEFGYMDKINEAKPILDNYYNDIVQLNKMDHYINQGSLFEDKAMDYVINGIRDTANIKRNTRRDYLESFTNFMTQAERERLRLTQLLEEAHQDIPATNPKSYSINVLKKTVDTEFNVRLKRMKDLEYQLGIVRNTYKNNNNFFKQHFTKVRKDIKRNNEVLKHCGSVINFTEQFKMLQVKLVNQAEDIEIDEKEVSVNTAAA